MCGRRQWACLALLSALAATPVTSAQTATGNALGTSKAAAGVADEASSKARTKPYVTPRTPWGDPDLQGLWSNQTSTPLERPNALQDKATLTQEEAEEREEAARLNADLPPPPGDPGTYNSFWREPGIAQTRTSLIVDPPDGRIPALTAEGRARQARAPARNNAVNASWLDRGNQERCITYGLPSASLPTLYNNNIQIVQAPGTAVIVHEMIHEARVVPLDGRPRLNDGVRAWIGSSRGWWEGDTLVVETTNFNGKNNYRGSTTGLHLVERYTRVGENRLELRLTVSDPTTWERPWTVLLPMRPTDGELIEYACHEHNLSMVNILEVARDAEKADAAGQAPRSPGPVDDRQER